MADLDLTQAIEAAVQVIAEQTSREALVPTEWDDWLDEDIEHFRFDAREIVRAAAPLIEAAARADERARIAAKIEAESVRRETTGDWWADSGKHRKAGWHAGMDTAARLARGDERDNAGKWLHLDGTPCPTHWAPHPRTIGGDLWWCLPHQQYVRVEGEHPQSAAITADPPMSVADLTVQRDRALARVAALDAEIDRLNALLARNHKAYVDMATRLT